MKIETLDDVQSLEFERNRLKQAIALYQEFKRNEDRKRLLKDEIEFLKGKLNKVFNKDL